MDTSRAKSDFVPTKKPKYASRPHPYPPSDQLGSPQISIRSIDDTPGTHLLTPPPTASERDLGSPPPKTDAGDYLSLGGRGSKSQRGKRRHRKNPFSSEEADTVSSHTHSSLGCPAESREGSSAYSRHTESNTFLPVTKDLAVQHLDKASLVDGARHTNASEDNAVFDVAIEIASPALESLRRCSTFAAPEAQGQRRLSQAFKSAFTALLTPDPIFSEMSQGTKFTASQRNEHKRRSESYRAGDQRCPTPNDRKLPVIDKSMPASITLRKASMMPGVITTGKTRQVNNNSFNREPNAAADSRSGTSSCDLLSFNTTQIDYTAPIGALRSEQTQARTGRRSSLTPLAPSSNMPHLGLYSTLADPATAVADVYIARRHTSIKPADGKLIIPQGMPLCRTSAVQIVSRNSVYEIIWQENDSPTSSSSSELRRSPTQRQLLSDYRGPISIEARNGSGPSTRSTSNKSSVSGTHQQANIDFSRYVEGTLLDQKDHKQTLFDWTWDRRQSVIDHVADERRLTSRPLEVLVPNGDSTTPHDRKRSNSTTFARLKDEPSVESFPPLKDRRSTSKWCIQPIVDLNDPMAGRPRRLTSLRETSTEDFPKGSESPHVAFDLPNERSSQFPNLQPDTQCRRVSDNKLGSAIGTSSHVRRKSARPFNTVVGSSRRNSVLRHNRSDNAIGSRYLDVAKVDGCNKRGSISGPTTPLGSGQIGAGPLFLPVSIPIRKQSQVLERTRILLGGDGAGDEVRLRSSWKGEKGVVGRVGEDVGNGDMVGDDVKGVGRIAENDVSSQPRRVGWSWLGMGF